MTSKKTHSTLTQENRIFDEKIGISSGILQVKVSYELS